MEQPIIQEIFDLMGRTQQTFAENCSGQPQYTNTIKSLNFTVIFTQNSVSGSQLVQGQNLFSDGITASVARYLQFKLAIFHNNYPGIEPLRIEVDNKNLSSGCKIIHINAADGTHYNIPQQLIEQINPNYPVDLVAISGTRIFRAAIDGSLASWKNVNCATNQDTT